MNAIDMVRTDGLDADGRPDIRHPWLANVWPVALREYQAWRSSHPHGNARTITVTTPFPAPEGLIKPSTLPPHGKLFGCDFEVVVDRAITETRVEVRA